MERYQYSAAQRALLEGTSIPLAIYQFIDKRVVTLVLSQGFCDLFVFKERADAYLRMDTDMYRNTHPDDLARIEDAAVRFAMEDTHYDVVYRERINGEYRILHAKGEHVYHDDGKIRVAVVYYTDEGPYTQAHTPYETVLNQNFSKSLHESSMVRRMRYDQLTGLPSMTYFFELAAAGQKALLEQGQRPALLFIDLNGMKFFNQKYGFSEGDRLIQAMGKVLARYFGTENCSRFGQDHFAVITASQGLEDRLEGLFEHCKTMNDGRNLPVRVGICLDSHESADVSTACDRAKIACDMNRSSYVSCYKYFSDDMLRQAKKRQYIIDNLDRAIREKWIQVHYQPIVRAANDRVSDEESLARWIDPEQGLLSPADFIPILEDARLIYKLDLYMVEETLAKLKKQQEAGLYLVPASINLSRTDFDACDMVEEIRRRVDESGLGRDKLSIEITESVIGSDFDFIKRQIDRFHALGFQVWMDDFGSGYSSLDVLQSAHFDLIKLDMRFMQQFDQGDKSRIILTELIKMAIGLGIDTVAEGVETQEQVDFLHEVGCTKLQGYYYTKPLPLESILERYREGKQIGFENPAETAYYSAIGRMNLYDLGIVANEDAESFQHYFDTLPMAVTECSDEIMTITRCNKSYRDFMKRVVGSDTRNALTVRFDQMLSGPGSLFAKAVHRCSQDGQRTLIDEEMEDGTTIHSFVRRIAQNPVTGIVACAVVVLAVIDEKSRKTEVTYARIAQALSTDFFNLYYVNLDTEQFNEYSSSTGQGDLAIERRGEDFFATSRRDAMQYIYPDDQPAFLKAFTKENLIRAMDQYGVFTITYRLLVNGEPVYMNMKATRMQASARHIIIGVSNVDAQMKQRQALERIRQEKITYSRISALAGDIICIYTVDPETNRYTEYSATREYEDLGLSKEGDDFFSQSRTDAEHKIHPDDLERLAAQFTKENVMNTISANGIFSIDYRLMINGEPQYVRLRAALVQEKDGPKLIVGVINVNAQTKREQEYAHNLSAARNMANIDGLTGVKNKNAFANVELQMDQMIRDYQPLEFAVLAFDVKGLEPIAKAQGQQAADQRLIDSCYLICKAFHHSPVFRVSSTGFVVIAKGEDYKNADALVASLEKTSRENRQTDSPVIDYGIARYAGEKHMAQVYDRACADLRQRRETNG